MMIIVDMRENQAIDFAPATLVDEVKQNIRTILSTYAESAPMAREIGISQTIVDEPTPILKVRMISEVTTAIMEQEPRAVVTEVIIHDDPETGRLSPLVKFGIEEV